MWILMWQKKESSISHLGSLEQIYLIKNSDHDFMIEMSHNR